MPQKDVFFQSLGIQSYCQRMIGVSNRPLRIVFKIGYITILSFGEPGSLRECIFFPPTSAPLRRFANPASSGFSLRIRFFLIHGLGNFFGANFESPQHPGVNVKV